MTTQQHTATVTIDATTQIVAKPAKQGWTVLAVENGQERQLGQSTVLGARRAIHEVLQQRNRATTRRTAGRSRAQRSDTRATTARRATVTPLAVLATGPDDQSAAWAALRRAVAQSRQTSVQATRPTPSAKLTRKPHRAPATAPTLAATPTPAPPPPPTPTTRARAEIKRRSTAAAAVTAGPAWGVHVTFDQVADDITVTATGTAVGEISAALSVALRDALGDRTGGRVRKALRRHGLITRPTVFEHELTTRGRTRRLRVHITPLDAPVGGDAAAAIRDRTRGLPVRRDLELLGA